MSRVPKRRLVVVGLLIASFLAGYIAPTVEAWPGVADRNIWYGYFRNQRDTVGHEVWMTGIPADIDSTEEFIDYTKDKLGGSQHERIGALFIINTMISSGSSFYSRNMATTGPHITEWENRVRAIGNTPGGISWFEWRGFTVNSYYQNDVVGGDDAFYFENGASSTITFRDSTGAVRYIIKRDCANPLGDITGLPPAMNYELTPEVSGAPAQAQVGDTITFNYAIRVTGTSTQNTFCVSRGNLRPGGWVPLPQQDGGRPSDGGYVPPPLACPQVLAANSYNPVGSETLVVGNLPPGQKLCRSLEIDPRNQNAPPQTRVSAEMCVTIAKSPTIHFTGNDVWAGGDFADQNAACNSNDAKIQTTARTLPDGSIAGGASEYAAYAANRIVQFGSASRALLNPSSAVGKSFTFANNNFAAPANLGFYGSGRHCIEDYLGQFASTPISGLPATIDVGGQGSGIWRVTGNRTFFGQVPNGATQVYIVQDGAVTIGTGSTGAPQDRIQYGNNYADITQMPSLVIISMCSNPATCTNSANAGGSIRVLPTVQQMDGLFVAKNTFYSCYGVADPLSVSTCNNQLVVNGAVVARQLELRRTHGADGTVAATRKRPAEHFNFTPEMYMRSALNGGSGATIETVTVRELPPRF